MKRNFTLTVNKNVKQTDDDRAHQKKNIHISNQKQIDLTKYNIFGFDIQTLLKNMLHYITINIFCAVVCICVVALIISKLPFLTDDMGKHFTCGISLIALVYVLYIVSSQILSFIEIEKYKDGSQLLRVENSLFFKTFEYDNDDLIVYEYLLHESTFSITDTYAGALLKGNIKVLVNHPLKENKTECKIVDSVFIPNHFNNFDEAFECLIAIENNESISNLDLKACASSREEFLKDFNTTASFLNSISSKIDDMRSFKNSLFSLNIAFIGCAFAVSFVLSIILCLPIWK